MNSNYIDNKKFCDEMRKYKKLCVEAENSGEEVPVVTDYIAQCFIDISVNLSSKQNFINYNFKDDMISDGIENCLLAVHNFDPTKKNPFSYFTQIVFFAFLRRIEKEKKQMYLKYRVISDSDIVEQLNTLIDLDESHIVKKYLNYFNSFDNYCTFEETRKEKLRGRKKKKKKIKNSLDKFIE